MKQFENTMKDVKNLMQENMSNEENIKVTDLEAMLRPVQRSKWHLTSPSIFF